MATPVKSPTRTVVVQARGIRKTFGHVEALRGVDFEARAGEVTALIGDNGAGKSSLVKILSGVYTADSGELLIDGKQVRPSSPQDIRAHGIETVYQDLALAGDLTPYENVFLGREKHMSGILGLFRVVDRRRMRNETAKVFDSLNVRIKDHKRRVASLSGGQQQSVAIARAAMWASHLVIMEEVKSVALIGGVKDSPFYSAIDCGAKTEAKKQGIKYTYAAPNTFDAAAQQPILSSVVAQGPQAILIAPTDKVAMF
jgi:simple sugar transport system ATP-binding protein